MENYPQIIFLTSYLKHCVTNIKYSTSVVKSYIIIPSMSLSETDCLTYDRHLVVQAQLNIELQIRGSNEDNSKIIFLISQQKCML